MKQEISSKGREMRVYQMGNNKYFIIVKGSEKDRAVKVIDLMGKRYFISVDADEVSKIKVINNTIVIDI